MDRIKTKRLKTGFQKVVPKFAFDNVCRSTQFYVFWQGISKGYCSVVRCSLAGRSKGILLGNKVFSGRAF